MFRTIIWCLYFLLYFITSLVGGVVYGLLILFTGKKLSRGFIIAYTGFWARSLFRLGGGKVTVIGSENLPKEDGLCFVANHEGMGDIPLVLGYIPKITGFIAKRELYVVPILNLWMLILGCIPIRRGNLKNAKKAIDKGVRRLLKGRNILVFPEGTRSRGGPMKPFKTGSLKLALGSGAPIIPLTIQGTSAMLEKHGKITPGAVRLIIHPPVSVAGLGGRQTHELARKLEEMIRESLIKT